MSPRALRKWYFCINARGFDFGLPQIKVAVASARQTTDLIPHCLYAGDDPAQIATLSDLGIIVIPHVPSFDADLRHGYGADYDRFVGHWLRVDLPLIEQEDPLVLYTDVDVMFLRQPLLHRAPQRIAAAPESDPTDWTAFNSGVMVMALPALRRRHAAFVSAIRHRLRHGFSYPAHDQLSFNQFFAPTLRNRLLRRAAQRLPLVNNWKPYWGVNPDARILHFHGPKAADIRVFERTGGVRPIQDGLIALWNRDRAAYDHYAQLWEAFSQNADTVPHRESRSDLLTSP